MRGSRKQDCDARAKAMKEKRVLAGELPLYCCRQHRQSVRLQAPASKIFVLKRRKLLELEKTELRVATGHMCFRSAHAYDQNTASQSQSQSPWQMLAKSQGPSDLRIAKMLSAEDPAMAGRQVKLLMQSRRISARPSSVSCMASSLSFLDTIRLLHFSLAFFMVVVQGAEILLDFRGPVLGRLPFGLHGIQLGHHAVQEGLHASGFGPGSIGVCQGIDLVAEPLVGRSLRFAILVVLVVGLGVRVLLGARGGLVRSIKIRGKRRESRAGYEGRPAILPFLHRSRIIFIAVSFQAFRDSLSHGKPLVHSLGLADLTGVHVLQHSRATGIGLLINNIGTEHSVDLVLLVPIEQFLPRLGLQNGLGIVRRHNFLWKPGPNFGSSKRATKKFLFFLLTVPGPVAAEASSQALWPSSLSLIAVFARPLTFRHSSIVRSGVADLSSGFVSFHLAIFSSRDISWSEASWEVSSGSVVAAAGVLKAAAGFFMAGISAAKAGEWGSLRTVLG